MKFLRIHRLLNKEEYHELYNSGKKYVGSKIIIFYRLAQSSNPKLGITITKKWGKAYRRNRFKRVVREAYRHESLKLPPNIELNVHPRKHYEKLLPKEVQLDLRMLATICDRKCFGI